MKLMVISLLLLSACVETIPGKVNTIVGDGENMEVIPPQNCPDWTKVDGNGGSNFGNTPDSNFGCATVTNFGAMLEDPYDMIEGRHTDLSSGARSATSAAQYESGGGSAAASSGTP